MLTILAVYFAGAQAQPVPAVEQVRAIAPPLHPLPLENRSVGVTKFSFIVYGDTRGRRDGKELQYEHSLVVDAMLATIKKMDTTSFPIRFVLQTGDAVVDGREAIQWNTSFVDLINRLTQQGGIPYYLAPGNHDVTSAADLKSTERQRGLHNYLSAVNQLIPPDGVPRRLSGYPTYAFGYGNAFFIAFDSNIADDETQFEWVKNQLEGLDRTRYHYVVVFCHHPAFSSGPHGGVKVEPPTAEIRERYVPLFRKHRVCILFSGHEHFFEHWVERYEDAGGKRQRLDHVLTGGGGAPLYWYTGEPELQEYLRDNATERVTLEHLVKPGIDPGDNAYHFVLVKLDGEMVSLEVIGVDWGRNFQPYRSKRVELQDVK